MLVNNDSCSRCDASIRAAILTNGWFVRTLQAKIAELIAYEQENFTLKLSKSIDVSAAISSLVPYNTGEPIEGYPTLFYSRGGTWKHIMIEGPQKQKEDTQKILSAPSRSEWKPNTVENPILKIYKNE
ncbi:MAG: hypothetical protein K6C34_01230 [Alphaproteobacteria bacterium]|nr:hypothetical protein [Alphaproteobacteria bacterium]